MHYKDGTPAQIGDIARGQGYNYPYPVQGVVTRVVPGQQGCSISVHFAQPGQPFDPADIKGSNFAKPVAGPVARYSEQKLLPVSLGEEHGTCGDFELVHRPKADQYGVLK